MGGTYVLVLGKSREIRACKTWVEMERQYVLVVGKRE
jgi:hypothetical protein